MQFTTTLLAATAMLTPVLGWTIQYGTGSASGTTRQGCTTVNRNHGPFLRWDNNKYSVGAPGAPYPGGLPPPTPFDAGGLPPPTPYGAQDPYAQQFGAPPAQPALVPYGQPGYGETCTLQLFTRRDCEGQRQVFSQDFVGNVNFDYRSYRVRCQRG